MKTFRFIGLALVVFGLVGSGFAQLGKGKGGGGGGQGSPPPKSNPPSNPPPKNDPPPKSNPPSNPPPKSEPPPRNNPPQSAPPTKNPPPRNEQPPQSMPPVKQPPSQSGQGSGVGGDRLGRIDRDNGKSDNGGLTEKAIREGRNNNGKAYSGSINNLTSKSNGRSTGGATSQGIRQLPAGSLSSQVIREDSVKRRHDYRSGYYHYNNNWCDDWFWNTNYVFSPNNGRCVVSPWYYYPSLPGYLNSNCITIINVGSGSWNGGYYNYYRPGNYGWGNNRRGDLDYAIDDIITAFEDQDRRALGRLIARNGRVDIYLDGRYDYSIQSENFYDLMLDGIYNTRTRRYDIVDVRTYRDEAEVVARHDYVDPWGRYATLYHWFRLEEDRRGFVITKFGTQSRRSW